jgi:hypothetical protein
MALMMQGADTSPVQHWTQGAARVAQSLIGGLELRREDQKEETEKASGRELYSRAIPLLTGGGQASIPSPAAASAVPSSIPQPTRKVSEALWSNPGANGATVQPVNGQRVLSYQDTPGEGPSNVPSPLDPPDPKSAALLAALVQAEAGNQGPAGKQAVANTVRNRAAESGMTIPQVIGQRGQFEPVGTGSINRYGPGTPGFNDAAAAAERAYTGNDPTAGAVNFYGPKSQAALAARDGRPPVAKFDNGAGIDIQDQRYFTRATGGASPGITEASAQSRAPTAGPQQANIAALLPALMNNKYTAPFAQSVVQALMQKQMENRDPTWGVVGEDDFGKKTYGWINPRTQTATPAAPQGGAATGQPAQPLTVTGPGGQQIPIPLGVNPKKFRDDVTGASADAATGKMTEVQAKSTQFANRMEAAERDMGKLQGEGTSIVGKALQDAPFGLNVAGNYMKSGDRQKFEQARSQFITGLLRQESGAAIGKEEFVRYDREFFPQPGDGPEVVQQKAEARKVAIEAMKKGAGPGYKSPVPTAPIGGGLSPEAQAAFEKYQ